MRTIPDISHYQKVDWAKFKPEVLIVKATEATSYVDPTLGKNIQEARKRNIPIGAYHFCRGGDAKKEAEWFLKNASDLDFLVCDWEIPHKDPVGWCKAFCDRVAQAGKPVLLYMNDGTAQLHDWTPCAKYPFWIARYKYPGGDPRDDGKPDEKYAPKSKWMLWQFTSNGKMDGIEGRVDLNQAKDEFFEFIKKPMEKKFIYPLDNVYVTQGFGERPEYYKKYGMKGHNGIDFRTKFWDSPLGKRYAVAVADGVVSAVILSPGSGYGNHVKIKHTDGSETLYAHLNKSYVFNGQQVKQGQRIALTNNTGDSSAAHLHFGYKPPKPNQNNGFLGSEDPTKFFK